jgi:plastocyanin
VSKMALLAVLVACVGLVGAAAEAQDYKAGTATALPEVAPGRKEVFVVTVHVDGNTGLQASAAHPAEAFPTAALPDGGGLVLTKPNADGQWRMRAFVFQPAQIVVEQGDVVGLNFVGVQGPSHRIAVEGVEEVLELKRGEVGRIEVQAKEPGTIRFASLDRLPSMQGEVVVLPHD